MPRAFIETDDGRPEAKLRAALLFSEHLHHPPQVSISRIGWRPKRSVELIGFRLIDSMVRGIHASLRSR
jgi:hypothetical protein